MIILLIKMLAVAVSIGAILCISTSAPGAPPHRCAAAPGAPGHRDRVGVRSVSGHF
jgi:hypothetical protein